MLAAAAEAAASLGQCNIRHCLVLHWTLNDHHATLYIQSDIHELCLTISQHCLVRLVMYLLYLQITLKMKFMADDPDSDMVRWSPVFATGK